MTAPLQIQTQKQDDWEYVLLKGSIMEGAEEKLDELLKRPGENYIIDFTHIATINSCGVAEWVKFIGEFTTKRTVYFDNVPTIVLRIINMIGSFCGQAKIRSIFLDFQCDKCGLEHREQFIAGENMPESSDVDLEYDCPKCDGTLAPIMSEKEVFAFLK